MENNFDDVKNFHQKFGLLAPDRPRELTKELLKERIEFMLEELFEFIEGSGINVKSAATVEGDVVIQATKEGDSNIAKQADALIDLVYVAMGTAVMMGLPWQKLWDDVQRANMSKVRGSTHRHHRVDVMKPPGWEPPQTEVILMGSGFDDSLPPLDYTEGADYE